MSSCPINLDIIPKGRTYSEAGLKGIHPKLTSLAPLKYSAEEQLKQARLRADKMSIQGVQPKLSAVLRIKEQSMELVDRGGKFILKPNPPLYEEVPANEALTMRMAQACGIEVPVHGLLQAVDGSWVYFIKRFDREGRSGKIHVEDFSQLMGANRETKYDSSLEQVVQTIDQYCSFPAVEKPKLAKRLLFSFLTGNEDMHLKNVSLWQKESVVSLTPAYDLLNTTVVLENAKEETALPLGGKRKHLTRKLWVDYFCKERLGLSDSQIDVILSQLSSSRAEWEALIGRSYLSDAAKDRYQDILAKRCASLKLA